MTAAEAALYALAVVLVALMGLGIGFVTGAWVRMRRRDRKVAGVSLSPGPTFYLVAHAGEWCASVTTSLHRAICNARELEAQGKQKVRVVRYAAEGDEPWRQA